MRRKSRKGIIAVTTLHFGKDEARARLFAERANPGWPITKVSWCDGCDMHKTGAIHVRQMPLTEINRPGYRVYPTWGED